MSEEAILLEVAVSYIEHSKKVDLSKFKEKKTPDYVIKAINYFNDVKSAASRLRGNYDVFLGVYSQNGSVFLGAAARDKATGLISKLEHKEVLTWELEIADFDLLTIDRNLCESPKYFEMQRDFIYSVAERLGFKRAEETSFFDLVKENCENRL